MQCRTERLDAKNLSAAPREQPAEEDAGLGVQMSTDLS